MPDDRYLPGLYDCERCGRQVRAYAEPYLDGVAVHCQQDHRHILRKLGRKVRAEPTQADVDEVAKRAGGAWVADLLDDADE